MGTAAALAVAGVLALAGCRVAAGAAAFVGADRISESAVSGYVDQTGAATPPAQRISPRTQAVVVLVQNQIYRDFLAAKGAPPTAAQLQTALATATGGQLEQQRAAAEKRIIASGFDRSFLQPVLTNAALQTLALQAAGLNPATTPSQAAVSSFLAQLNQAAGGVRLSQRYGTWNDSQLTASGIATPPYLRLAQPLTGPVATGQ